MIKTLKISLIFHLDFLERTQTVVKDGNQVDYNYKHPIYGFENVSIEKQQLVAYLKTSQKSILKVIGPSFYVNNEKQIKKINRITFSI